MEPDPNRAPFSGGLISMKFSKTKGPSLVRPSSIRDPSTQDEEEETDFVTSVDKRQIHGTKKKVKKEELVIPLITRNEWRQDMDRRAEEAAASSGTSNRPPPTPMSLEEQAVQELLIGQSNNAPTEDDVPLLLANAVPAGYEEEDALDVSLRPETSTLEDYERVPIDLFGMAMLRGMGWSKEEGIGLRNKQHVEIVEPVLRAKGLGLGASVSSGATKNVTNVADGKKEENLVFKIGAAALIQRGVDKGMYGKIEGFDEDNSRVVIKLAISGKMAAVSKFHMVLVKESEYKGKSKVLNYDQYSEYKEKQDAKEKERRSQEDESDSRSDRNILGGNSSSNRNKSSHRDRDRRDEKRSKHQNGSSSKSSHSRSSWVRPHLKVRFIDKKYKSGKYYGKKFVVEDVIAEDRFVLRSAPEEAANSFLEDIHSSQIETVIPKIPGTSVSILSGRDIKGRIGELVDRGRKGEETAIVKIPDAGVFELKYDDICEFVGDPEDYF